MRKVRKGFRNAGKGYETWKRISKGSLRLNWGNEMKGRVKWGINQERIKRTYRKGSRNEIETEDWNNEAKNWLWKRKGKTKDSRRTLNKTS